MALAQAQEPLRFPNPHTETTTPHSGSRWSFLSDSLRPYPRLSAALAAAIVVVPLGVMAYEAVHLPQLGAHTVLDMTDRLAARARPATPEPTTPPLGEIKDAQRLRESLDKVSEAIAGLGQSDASQEKSIAQLQQLIAASAQSLSAVTQLQQQLVESRRQSDASLAQLHRDLADLKRQQVALAEKLRAVEPVPGPPVTTSPATNTAAPATNTAAPTPPSTAKAQPRRGDRDPWNRFMLPPPGGRP